MNIGKRFNEGEIRNPKFIQVDYFGGVYLFYGIILDGFIGPLVKVNITRY